MTKLYLKVLFITAQNCGETSKCPIIDEWISKFSLWDDRVRPLKVILKTTTEPCGKHLLKVY